MRRGRVVALAQRLQLAADCIRPPQTKECTVLAHTPVCKLVKRQPETLRCVAVVRLDGGVVLIEEQGAHVPLGVVCGCAPLRCRKVIVLTHGSMHLHARSRLVHKAQSVEIIHRLMILWSGWMRC